VARAKPVSVSQALLTVNEGFLSRLSQINKIFDKNKMFQVVSYEIFNDAVSNQTI
jgi:hypothetical protein